MNAGQHRSVFLAALIAVIAGVTLVPMPADAQGNVLSPVPKDRCCLTNFRFAGTCQVMPRQGQLCENILSYLNNFNSAGEDYCSSTYIRGGWTLVDCASGAAAGQIGHMDKQFIEVEQPASATFTSPSSATDSKLPGRNTAPTIDPSQLKVRDASVIQVRLEKPLDGSNLVAGQQFSGRLEADVLGPDGEVIAPAGSTISAQVGAESAWDDSPRPSNLQLQLVGTTTSAADLFGTAEVVAAAGPSDEAAVHSTGDLVELPQDSVLTFQLNDVSEQPADMRVLTTATDVWMKAFNSGDAVTIAGLSSENGALLPPNGRAIVGRDAIYSFWKDLLADSKTTVELVNIETVVEGDYGYKAGRFELLDATTGAPIDQGKYIQIWKRSPQGTWELHRDMWNSSINPGS
jgi:ketosteroid isomerase-like protein